MIRPAEDLALYRAEMAPGRARTPLRDWQEDDRDWVRGQRRLPRATSSTGCGRTAPLPARELPDTCDVPWRSTGWTNNRNVTRLLEFMVPRGEVAVAGRRGPGTAVGPRRAGLPGRPAVPGRRGAARTATERRLRRSGIARARGPECPVEPLDVGEAGEPAVVEGVRGSWRVDPAQLGRAVPRPRRAAVAASTGWSYDRKRMAELFEFDYQLEMYKPAAKRRWGYYALPILYGDRLVGKLDATADRQAGVLRVDAVHEDAPFTKTMRAAIDKEIRDLGKWLELEVEA